MEEKKQGILLTETFNDISKKLVDLKIKKEKLEKNLEELRKKIESTKEEENIVEKHMEILLREEANLNDLLYEEEGLNKEKEIDNKVGEMIEKTKKKFS